MKKNNYIFYNLDILNKQNQFIYEQVNKINQINTSINALK